MTPPTLPTTEMIREALRNVYDPEFGVSVEDLGLIYAIELNDGHVRVTMTLTSMYCPAGDVIIGGVRAAIEQMAGVTTVEVDLVWTPTWTPELLSASARQQLGWDVPQVDE